MRVLFVSATRIGDAILSTGLLDELIRRGGRVTVACGPLPAPLFRGIAGVERVIEVTKRPGGRHWLQLWAAVAAMRWDLVVDLRGSALAWTLRAGRRRVFRGTGRRHKVVELATCLGFDPPPGPVWRPTPEATAAAAARLPAAGPLLAVGPTANWEGKRWPTDRFVELALRLTGRDGILPGAHLLVLGAPGERPRVAEALQRLPAERTTELFDAGLPLAGACLARADFFIGNDSGLMHLAAATGTPTLGLFGPSRDASYAPWGELAAFVRTPESYETLATRPEFVRPDASSLMTGLTVDTVEAAAHALWARVAGTRSAGPDTVTPAQTAS